MGCDRVYCPNCGKEADAGDRFCKHCSFRLTGSEPDEHGMGGSDNREIFNDPRSTGLAMFLSIILPGLGAYYIDGEKKGLEIFIISLVLLIAVNTVLLFLFPVIALALVVLWAIGLKVTSGAIDSYRRKYPL